MRVAGERRWIAAEDAGLYRDALGTASPAGVPDAFLAPVSEPLPTLFRRFARHHGPFLSADVAARFDLLGGQVEPVLRVLEVESVLIRGEIRPGGAELDWCDSEVLRRLKRRNLARLRDEVAAVDTQTLAAFLPVWHELGSDRGGVERLTEVEGRLIGIETKLNNLLSPLRDIGVAVGQKVCVFGFWCVSVNDVLWAIEHGKRIIGLAALEKAVNKILDPIINKITGPLRSAFPTVLDYPEFDLELPDQTALLDKINVWDGIIIALRELLRTPTIFQCAESDGVLEDTRVSGERQHDVGAANGE